jgi:putative nucleotidyltransferase with HDIG domain
MYRKINETLLIDEEQRALKWFLTLFYFIYIFYEVFYHFFYKNIDSNLPRDINFLTYIGLIFLLPLPWILRRRGKVHLVKYIFVIGYLIISIFNEILIYSKGNLEYQSGNAVELLIVLFTPFFVNTRFFWVVTSALISKYLFFGVLLESELILAPVTFLVILSGMAFILLKRFQSYVRSVKNSFEYQLEGIVKGVIATIELKDPYTRGHSERVAYYANSLATKTGVFTEEELSAFNYACLLHDIGKVNIPDSILMKPGKLSKEEFDVIKTHPTVGAEAIIKVRGLEDSIDVIKSHHERWDGKGYPEQLKGDKIPYLARIVSIADAFDAMTSSRSYRAAMPVEEAYKRILEGKGTQFDPNLVEMFIDVFPDWISFHLKYQWSESRPNKNYVI